MLSYLAILVAFLLGKPASAAVFNFDFTTQTGGEGAFVLHTDTPPDTELAVLFQDGVAQIQGLQYPGAVSDFSLSLPSRESVTFPVGDLALFPSANGALGVVGAPTRTQPDQFAIAQVAFDYSGELDTLPVLSSQPGSYSGLGEIVVFESAKFTAGVVAVDVAADIVVQVQAISTQSIPEPGAITGVLAIAFTGVIMPRLRKIKRNTVPH